MDFAVTTGTDAELAKLDGYLTTHMYLDGLHPSQTDARTYSKVPRSLNPAKYRHVARWARHMDSFHPSVRERWPKGKNQERVVEEKKGGGQTPQRGQTPQKAKTPQRGQTPQQRGQTPDKSESKKESKKDKKDKKKERPPAEPEPVVEEPEAEAAAEAEAEAPAEEAAAEEAPAAEEEAPAEEAEEDEGNLDLDDLIGDAEDDEATKAMFNSQKEKIREIQARQAAGAGKAKSNLTLDVKPVDTDVDMAALEAKIRALDIEGCKWLGGQLIDVAYGIKKLRIMCQLVDVLVNPDTVREEIEKFEDEVQSTDVFAFQMA